MAFDEGDHVVFEATEIVGDGRHMGLWIIALYA
jgi:hypothetical protein